MAIVRSWMPAGRKFGTLEENMIPFVHVDCPNCGYCNRLQADIKELIGKGICCNDCMMIFSVDRADNNI